jgi:hypothetical protein
MAFSFNRLGNKDREPTVALWRVFAAGGRGIVHDGMR